MTRFKPGIVDIAEICAQKGLSSAIISPGSRSAPLSLAFLRHPRLTCRTIVDERSAAFVALGMAQRSNSPSVLICTSGTAALNYGPAIAEAFYQKVPLLVLTADRPPEWINQYDGQTIDQYELFRPHCRRFFSLPVDQGHADAKWHVERIVSEAIIQTQLPIAGPVHINVPLREPLYPTTDLSYSSQHKLISVADGFSQISQTTLDELAATWQEHDTKMVVVGLHPPNGSLSESLRRLEEKHQVVVLHDITSNSAHVTDHHDIILSADRNRASRALAPDLLISLGGPVVSKSLKTYLRHHKAKEHWHVQPGYDCVDPFQSLTRIIPAISASFVSRLVEALADRPAPELENGKKYRSGWRREEALARKALAVFLNDLGHSELPVMQFILNRLPKKSYLHLGNSSIVRLASYVGISKQGVVINSNRGTSGIDGTLSTAVGAALAGSALTTIILGDLAFFYDRNGLWHRYLPRNLRIIIFNNYGGGIFRTLDGSRQLPELAQHFEVEHCISAENTAVDFGLSYCECDSEADLDECLDDFFGEADAAKILEIKFDKKKNSNDFLKFRSMMRAL